MNINESFRKTDSNLLAELIDRFNNGKSDSRYIVALSILDYLDIKTKFQKRKDNSVVASRDDIALEIFVDGRTLSFCLNLLMKAQLIKSTRKHSINGVNIYTIDYGQWEYLASRGKKIRENTHEKKKEIAAKIKKESIEKIISNRKKSAWTKFETDIINDMAYDEISKDDKYKTGLNESERFIIQIISKSYTKYTGKRLRWNYRMFNVVRKQIVGVSRTDYRNKLDEYENIEKTMCLPQRLVDIGKLFSSKYFYKITNCKCKATGPRIALADKNLSSIIGILYDASDDDRFNRYFYLERLKKCPTVEDSSYYLNSVKIDSNFKVADNPIDLYYKKVV